MTESQIQNGLFRGQRLSVCNETGFKGRVAIFEIMPMTDELKDLVLQGVSSVELKRGDSSWHEDATTIGAQ